MALNESSKEKYFNPSATVTAVIYKEKEDGIYVLLTRRNIKPFQGRWCFPGGHIDRYEPSKRAIIREVKEETGLDFTGKYFGVFDEIFPELNIHNVVTAFAGRGSGILNAQNTEVSDIHWTPVSRASEMELAFTHNKVLDTFTHWINFESIADG